MHKALRLTIVTVLTFCSSVFAMISILALNEFAIGNLEFSIYPIGVLASLLAFCIYCIGYIVYNVVTGAEFD